MTGYPNYACVGGYVGVQHNDGSFEALAGPFETGEQAAKALHAIRQEHQSIFEAGGYLDHLY